MITFVPGVGRSLKMRKNDLYETPAVAVLALLRVENVPAVIWEPCCGPGAITRVLRSSGRRVIATDLVDYQSPDQDFARRDFLMEQSSPPGVQAIVTNPPYSLVNQFVPHALRLCPRVILLLRYLFMESHCVRNDVLDCGRLARIYVFANRLPGLHRADWEGKKAGNSVAYAWFVWDVNYRGPALTKRIRWTASRNAAAAGCYGCGLLLPAGRADRHWCSDACRQRAYRLRRKGAA
jgi:hypothetical protein